MKKILLSLVIAFPVSFFAQDIEAGLVGYWLMNDEDEMIDQSGEGLDGYISSGAFTEDRFGVEDEAIVFDGTFDYAVIPGEDAYDEITTVDDATFSISLWHQTGDVIPGLNPLIVKYGHSGCGDTDRQWGVLIGADEGIRFYYASTPDNVNYRSISTINVVAQEPNTWYHIVATYDGSIDTNDGLDRVQIYVDNVLEPDTLNFNPGELGETINDAGAPIGLMSYVSTDESSCGDFNAVGALDDIRFYDRVITAAEVQLLYNGTVGVSEITLEEAVSINPSIIEDGILRLRATEQLQDVRIEILSTAGLLIQSEEHSTMQGDINIMLDEMAAGAYLVRLITQEGGQAVKRVILK